jgi:hypothetical protein
MTSKVRGMASAIQTLSNKNLFVNGRLNLWQRGTVLANGVNGSYLADKWKNYSGGSTTAVSLQNFTLGQTAVPGEPKFYHRTIVTSVAGAANYALTMHYIESVRTLAGQMGTLSFWAKADAAKNICIEFGQSFGTGGSALIDGLSITTIPLTTTWTWYDVQVAVPSIAGKTIGSNDNLHMYIWMDAGSSYASKSNNLGQQSGTFDIAQLQFEPGSAATSIELLDPTVEFLMCRRYYQTITCLQTAYGPAGQLIQQYWNLPVVMARVPSITVGAAYGNASGFTYSSPSATGVAGQFTITATGSATCNAYMNFDADY